MLSTAIFLTALVASVALSVGLHALFLKWGVRWAKIGDVTMLRAVGVVLLLFVADCLTAVGLSMVPLGRNGFLRGLIGFGVTLLVSCVVIALVFKARFPRAVQAFLPTLIPSFVFLLLAVAVIRPFFYEGFYCPTNSMAPALVGPHCEGTCPRCGHTAYGSVLPPGQRIPPDGLMMICGNELSSCFATDFDRQTRPADRFLVSKFLSFNRWDIVVLHPPDDPGELYAKRIVGLPGETVVIRDGAVWIDGQICPVPESLRGIEYVDGIRGLPLAWGDESNPATLGPDEYFVLGDFSAQSLDSRFWSVGAPGHPPYAVPASYIVGVVTHIYWPVDRWRILR